MKDIRTVEEILSQENMDEEWIWESIIRAKTVNIISGDESSGKTTLMINLCKAISDGEEFLGLRTVRQKILYISSVSDSGNSNGTWIIFSRYSFPLFV